MPFLLAITQSKCACTWSGEPTVGRREPVASDANASKAGGLLADATVSGTAMAPFDVVIPLSPAAANNPEAQGGPMGYIGGQASLLTEEPASKM